MTRHAPPLVLLGAASALSLSLAACNRPSSTPPADAAAPAAESKSTAQTASPDMQKVLDKLASLGGKPIETLNEVDARKQPSPADAVKALMQEQGIQPDASVTTKDVTYSGAAGPQKARVYTPPNASGALPVVLYIHGGGWVIADLDTYDASPRAIAKAANAIVVSVEYRHAPEAKFPAAHDDVNAAYKWVLANAANWGGDPKKVAVVGESAGGNMAVNVAITARDQHLQAPLAVVSVYPVADSNMATPSKLTHVATKPLNTKMLAWFFAKILPKPQDALDPRLNLVGADLRNLPPTTIILAQIDPLHDDGANLFGKMRDAGDNVDLKEYAGVTHEFFGMGTVVPAAKEAEDYAAAKLKAAFGS